jgi:hypothetical protein
MAEAFRKGDALPDAGPLVEAEADQRAWELRRQMLDDLLEQTETHLVSVTLGGADRIIVDHLRPALEQVVDQARAATAACPADNAQALLLAGEMARKAWVELETLTARYGAIRTARDALVRVAGPPQKDFNGQFAEMRNLADLVPAGRLRPGMPMPWPDDSRGRFVWLLRNGAELHMPTPAEQDAAWEAARPQRPVQNVPVAL